MKVYKDVMKRILALVMAIVMIGGTWTQDLTAYAAEVNQTQEAVIPDTANQDESDEAGSDGVALVEDGQEEVNEDAPETKDPETTEPEVTEPETEEKTEETVEEPKEEVVPEKKNESKVPEAEVSFDATKEVDGVSIKVTADKGVFPEGATLNVKSVTNYFNKKKIEKAVEEALDEEEEIQEMISYDITVLDKDGNEIQPDTDKGQVYVTFSKIDMEDGDEIKVFHMDDSLKNATELGSDEAGVETITVETDGFSTYTLVTVTTEAPDASHGISGGVNVGAEGTIEYDYQRVETLNFKMYMEKGTSVGYTAVAYYKDNAGVFKTDATVSDTIKFDSTGNVAGPASGDKGEIEVSIDFGTSCTYLAAETEYRVVVNFSNGVILCTSPERTSFYSAEEGSWADVGAYYGNVFTVGLSGQEANPEDVSISGIVDPSKSVLVYTADEEPTLSTTLTKNIKRNITWSISGTKPVGVDISRTTGKLTNKNKTACAVNIKAECPGGFSREVSVYFITFSLSNNTFEYKKNTSQVPVITMDYAGQTTYVSSNSAFPFIVTPPTEAKNVGEKTITLAGRDSSTDGLNYTLKYEITPQPLDPDKFEPSATVTYEINSASGAVKINGVTEYSTSDYLVSDSKKNVADGIEHTITITGVGNYTGTVTKKIKTNGNISDYYKVDWDTGKDQYEYDGGDIEPALTTWFLRNKSTGIKLDKSNFKNALGQDTIHVEYEENHKDVGSKLMKITIDGYDGYLSLFYTINERSITDAKIVWQSTGTNLLEMPHTGEAIEPALEITYTSTKVTDQPLVLGQDYNVIFSNNVGIGKATATVRGINNFNGSTKIYFDIEPAFDEDLEVLVERNTIYKATKNTGWASNYTATYTGNDVHPNLYVKLNGNTLTDYSSAPNKDTLGSDIEGYAIDWSICPDMRNVGQNKEIRIYGVGKYKGKEVSIKFAIGAAEITDAYFVPQSSLNPSYSKTFENESLTVVQDTDFTLSYNGTPLVKGKDYGEITYSSADTKNVQSNKIYYTITGQGNFTGELNFGYFYITPRTIENGLSSGVLIKRTDSNTNPRGEYVFDGNPIHPGITVTVNNVAVDTSDFTVEYGDALKNDTNVNADIPIVVKGRGNLTGTYTGLKYTIVTRDFTGLSISLDGKTAVKNGSTYYVSDTGYVYSGNIKKGTVVVTDASGNRLIQNTDYTVTFYDNINATDPLNKTAGAHFVITPAGNYTGTPITVYFNIDKKSIANETYVKLIADPTIVSTGSYKDENGVPQTNLRVPAKIEVKDIDTALNMSRQGKDINSGCTPGKENYEIIYVKGCQGASPSEDNELKIVGKNNYTGERTLHFEIGKNINTARLRVLHPYNPNLDDDTAGEEYDKTASGYYRMTYTGIVPRTVLTVNNDTVVLVQDQDYTMEYKSNQDATNTARIATDPYATDSFGGNNTVTAYIKGEGEYYGTISYPYRVEQRNLSNSGAEVIYSDNNPYKNGSDFNGYIYSKAAYDADIAIHIVDGRTVAAGAVSCAGEETKVINLKSPEGMAQFTYTPHTFGPDAASRNVILGYNMTIDALNSNFKGSFSSLQYRINRLNIETVGVSGASITIADQQYTGGQITPRGDDVVVIVDDPRNNGQTIRLVEGVDYKLSYGANKSVGDKSGSVTVTGINNCEGAVTGYFKISKVAAGGNDRFRVEVKEQLFTGSQVKPAGSDVVVTFDDVPLTPGVDYRIAAYGPNSTIGYSTNNYVKVEATADSKYEGSVTAYFKTYVPLDQCNITTEVGKEFAVDDVIRADDFVVKTKVGGQTVPRQVVDANGQMETNYEIETVPTTTPGEKSVIFKGSHDLSRNCLAGAATHNIIVYAYLNKDDYPSQVYRNNYAWIDNGDTDYPDSFVFEGRRIGVEQYVKVLWGELGTDYTIVATSDDYQSVKGTAHTIKVKPLSGSKIYKYDAGGAYDANLQFYIKYDLNDRNTAIKVLLESVEQREVQYTGNLIDTYVEATLGVSGATQKTISSNDKLAITSTPSQIKEVGNYTLTIKPKAGDENLFRGSNRNVLIKVTGKNLPSSGYTLSTGTKGAGVWYYTGNAIEPEVTITDGGVGTLAKGKDYTLTYKTNINVGTGYVVVTGKGAYSGTKEIPFTIDKMPINQTYADPISGLTYQVDVDMQGTYTWNGNRPVNPVVALRYNNRVLTKDVDYQVTYTNPVNAGPASLTLTGIGNFENTRVENYTVDPLDLSTNTAIKYTEYAEYTGEVIDERDIIKVYTRPDVDDPECYELVNGTDFDLVVTPQDPTQTQIKEKGRYNVTIVARADNTNIIGQRSFVFEVRNRSIGANWYKYNNAPGTAGAPATDTQKKATKGICVTVPDLDWNYGLEAKHGDGINASKQIELIDYARGESQAVTLVEGVDYTLTYGNNINSAPGLYDAANPDAYGNKMPVDGSPYVIIRGMGNYLEEELYIPFSIGTSLEDTNVVDGVTYPCVNIALTGNGDEYATYNGEQHKPIKVTVQLGQNSNLPQTNYSITYPEDMTSAGEKTVIVEGKDAFYGTLEKKYFIYQRVINESNKDDIVANLEFDTAEYNGYPIKPTVSVTDTGIRKNRILTEGEDFTVIYDRPDVISTAEVKSKVHIFLGNEVGAGVGNVLDGIGNYCHTANGVITLEYTIKPHNVSDFIVQLENDSNSFYGWTGEPVEPTIKVYKKRMDNSDEILTLDTDYEVEYDINHTDPGTHTLTVRGIGNYTGTKTIEYIIKADVEKATVVTLNDDGEIVQTGIPVQFFTDPRTMPKIGLWLSGGTTDLIIPEDEYTVEYDDSSNFDYVNYGGLIIKGISNYFGGLKRESYEIDTNEELVTVGGYKETYFYTGQPIKPNFELRGPSGNALNTTSMTVKFSRRSGGVAVRDEDLIEPGRVFVKISAVVNGTTLNMTELFYDIVECPIEKTTIFVGQNNRYTGKKVKPTVMVWSEGVLLVENTDYSLSYSGDTIKPTRKDDSAKPKVVITGLGHFNGTTEQTFEIRPDQVTGLTAEAESNAVKLKWLGSRYCDGYLVYKKITKEDGTKEYKAIGSLTANNKCTATIGGLTAGTEYEFAVQPYVLYGNARDAYYGDMVEITTRTPAKKTSLALDNRTPGKIKITWEKTDGADRYKVMRKGPEDSDYKMICSFPSSVNYTSIYDSTDLVTGYTYTYKVISCIYVVDDEKTTDPANPVLKLVNGEESEEVSAIVL